MNITKDIGYQATSYQEINTIINGLSKLPVDQKETYKLSPLIKNFNSVESSIEKLAERVHESIRSKPTNKINLSKIKRQAFFYRAILSCKEMSRHFVAEKKKNIYMFKSHFPGFQQSKVEEKVKHMNKILGKNCMVEHISKDLFVIYS